MIFALEAYDTDAREVRCRTWTTSKAKAKRWAAIPRINFTDSYHGIVFQAIDHTGARASVGEPLNPDVARRYWEHVDE